MSDWIGRKSTIAVVPDLSVRIRNHLRNLYVHILLRQRQLIRNFNINLVLDNVIVERKTVSNTVYLK